MAVRPRSCAAGNRGGRAPARPMANSLDLLDSHYLQNIQKTNILSHRPMDFKLPHDVISTCAKRDEPQADGSHLELRSLMAYCLWLKGYPINP